MAETKIFGRAQELASLDNYIESGKGVCLVKGPAGIGKSALVEQAVQAAAEKGYKIISGKALPGCSAPYHSFVDAFKKAGLEDVLVYQPPAIKQVLCITKGGLPYLDVGTGKVDKDLFAGMLTAIKDFVNQSLGTGELGKIEYGSKDILIIPGKFGYAAVIVQGQTTQGLKRDLKDALEKIEDTYKDKLPTWDGVVTTFSGAEEILNPVIERYSGTKYDLDPKNERDRLFENASQMLSEKNTKQPLLMFIDDLQWADPSSLALLHHLTRNNIKVIATYRTEDASKDSEELVSNLKRENLYNGLELHGLDKKALTQMLSEHYGAAPEKFVDRLQKETEGNPLFTTEALKLLEQEKVISKYNTDWASKDFDSIKLPTSDGVQAIIEQRLSRLSENASDVLEWAAVCGPEFYESILEELTEKNPREFGKAIRELAEAGVIKNAEGKSAFSHSKLREFVYSRLRDSELTWMHGEVATALEGTGSTTDLAWHFWKASLGNKVGKDIAEKSIKYNLKAAEDAKSKWANREALQFYSRALINSFRTDSDLEQILQNMAQLTELVGELDIATNYYVSLLDAAGKKNDTELEAKVLNNLGWIQIDKNTSKSLEYLNKALEKSENLANKDTSHNVRYSLGTLYWRNADYKNAIGHFEEILEAKDSSEDLKGKALLKLGNISKEKGEFNKAIEYFAKSANIFREKNNLQELSKVYTWLGLTYECNKDYASALNYSKKSLDLAKQINSSYLQAYAYNNVGLDLIQLGDYTEAEKYLKEGITLIQNLDIKEFSQIYDSFGLLYKEKGEFDKAVKMYEKAIVTGHCSVYNESEFSYDLGILYLEQLNVNKAKACFENALKIIRKSDCELKTKIIEKLNSLKN